MKDGETSMKINRTYTDIYNLIPEQKQPIARKLINELQFMERTLTALRKVVDSEGVTEHFINGKQDFWRESTALKSYNTTIQRYSSLSKQLTDMVDKTAEAENNPVLDFIKGE